MPKRTRSGTISNPGPPAKRARTALRRSPKRALKINRRRNMRNSVKTIVRNMAEKKYGERDEDAWTGYSTAAVIDDFTLIGQGDTVTTRDGDKVHLTGYKYDVNCAYASTGLGTYFNFSYVRFMLVRWLPDTASGNPTLNEILEDTFTSARQMFSVYVRDPAKRAKFNILEDHRFIVGAPTSPGKNPITSPYQVKTFSRKLNQTLHFNSGVTSGKGHIFRIIFSDNYGTGENPGLKLNGKIYYTDI